MNSKKLFRVQVRLNKEDHDAFKNLALKERECMSSLIRRLILKALRK